MTPDPLAAFIEARLAETAAAAVGAGRIAWLTYRDSAGQMLYTTVAAVSMDDEIWVADGRQLPEPASVSVVFDESRVLRDVAAKRAILARHAPVEAPGRGVRCSWCSDEFDHPWPCEDVRDLAAIDAGHPDYDPSWAPGES